MGLTRSGEKLHAYTQKEKVCETNKAQGGGMVGDGSADFNKERGFGSES